MYLTRKNNNLFIGGILLTIFVVVPVLFFVLYTKKSNEAFYIPQKTPFEERKPARAQEEIWIDYKKNINQLLSLINSSDENIDVILSEVEAGFFDIFVPTKKKDLHIQTLLQIQKIKSNSDIDSQEKLQEYIVPLLNALLDKN